jgi:O-antigen/teichoic acid export membrane protein
VSKKHFKELFIFGRNIVGTRLLNFFKRRSDDILIGYFLGPTALGYYTIAYQLLLVITRLLLNVINAVALPAFSRLQNDPAEMRQAFYTATYYASLIAFPAFLGISVMAPELVLAFYGPKWAPSIPVAQMLGLAGILQALFFFNGHIIVAAGKPAWYLTLMIVQSLTSLFVFAVAVHWGIVAVAAAFVIRGYLTAPLALWMLKKLIRIELMTFLREHLAPLVGALVMVIAVVGVKQFLGDLLNLYVLIAVGVGCGMVVYVATILLIKPQLARQALDLIYLVTPKLKWSYGLGSRE